MVAITLPGSPGEVPRVVERLRLSAVCLAITLLTFTQQSGAPAGDTKLDLVVTPWRFLRGGLSMWDPLGSGGQMQDQSYGYLFPMGPVFLVGHWIDLPAWIVQRSWESALLVAALLGVVRLSGELGVQRFWPRVAAGLCYALAPRMLFEVGVISAELMPVAALPWVLFPLVRVANRGGSPRRAAAASGLALLFAGGVNAAATLAILPAPALWILTRTGPTRRALGGWWSLAVLLASTWWIAPLVILGRYSPPFLDWIESSSTTTGQTDLTQVLRGVPHWQPFLGPQEWPAGWMFVAAPAVIAATAVIAGLGLAGLARPDAPHRRYLVITLLVGLVLVTAGHVTSVGPAFAPSVRDLLDGALSAFRNVHKFEPLVRLPIAIGAGYACGALANWTERRPLLRAPDGSIAVPSRVLTAGTLLAVLAIAIAPALDGKLIAKPRSLVEPAWWTATGHWLGSHAAGGRALVVPGAAVPVYAWGKPGDDPLQPVAGNPWAVRDNVPFGQAGFVRLLDTIDVSLASGQPDASLPAVLARAGFRYLVIRNDLDTLASDATPLRYVHAAIENNPAFHEVARFGPDEFPEVDPGQLTDLGLTRTRPAVEVYANSKWHGMVGLTSAAAAIHANGSSDALPALVAAGLAPATSVIFDDDYASGPVVLTDGIRRREFGFGSVGNYSTTMTANQSYRLDRAVHDYLPDGSGPLTVARYSGIAGVDASSSADDVSALFYRGPQYSPWAALDGDVDTAWVSAAGDGAVGQWLQVDLDATQTPTSIGIAFAPDVGPYPSRVRVATAAGVRDVNVLANSEPQHIAVPPGPTRWIRLTVLATTQPSAPGAQVGVTALSVPDVDPQRTLDVTGPLDPDTMVFSVAPGYRPACLTIVAAAACDSSWGAAGDEDGELSRTFRLDPGGAYTPVTRFRVQAGNSLDALLDTGNLLNAKVSSRNSADPRERPGAAVDGDAETGWVAAASDRTPTITIGLLAARRITGVRIEPMSGAPVAAPTRVQVRAGDQTVITTLGPSGLVAFPVPVRTDQVRVTVLASRLRVSSDSITGRTRILPVGIAEVGLMGTTVHGSAAQTVTLPCGELPDLRVDGIAIPLQATASAADVLAGKPVSAVSCLGGSVTLGADVHTVAVRANDLASPVALTLTRSDTGPTTSPPPGTMQVGSWGRTSRTVNVDTTTAALLVVRENVNGGWRATLGGSVLQPITVDGWEQGWLLPAGSSGTVHLDYRPQAVANAGFIAGGVAILVLLACALTRGRRRTTPPSAEWQPGRVVRAAIVIGGLGLLGSIAGLAIAIVLVIARRFVAVPGWLAGALALMAGVIAAAGPAGSTHRWDDTAPAQVVCLLVVGIVLLRGGEPE